jgi:hypothetical protein
MSAALKRFSARVKRVRARHPNMSFKAAQKMCSKNPSAGKVSGASRHKRGKPRRRIGKTATATATVTSTQGNKTGTKTVTGRRRRVGVTPMRAAIIGSLTPAGKIAVARNAIREQLAWNLLNVSQAKKVSVRRKLQKRSTELKRKLRALC